RARPPRTTTPWRAASARDWRRPARVPARRRDRLPPTPTLRRASPRALDGRLGRRVAVDGEVSLDALDGGLEIGADDLAPFGEVGAANELVEVETGPVEIDLEPIDELAGHDPGGDEGARALAPREHATPREQAAPEELAQDRPDPSRCQRIARLEDRDRRDLDVVPHIAFEHHGDPRDRPVGKAGEVGGRVEDRHLRRRLDGSRQGDRQDGLRGWGLRRLRARQRWGHREREREHKRKREGQRSTERYEGEKAHPAPSATRTRAASEGPSRCCPAPTMKRR